MHCAILAQTHTQESEELVKYLVQQFPAGLETKSVEGYTPLALAFSLHRQEFAKILVDAGADQTTRDRYGNNILHLLLCDMENRTCKDTKTLQPLLSLIDHRLIESLLAGRTCKRPGSMTPFGLWLQRSYEFENHGRSHRRNRNPINEEKEGKVAVAQLILDFAQPTGQKHLEFLNGAGYSPVHDAVKGELPRTLDLMLARRPDLLHRESATGTTPLEMAADAWVNKTTSDPPVIAGRKPWWGEMERPEHKSLLLMRPDYFIRDQNSDFGGVEYDAPRLVYNVCLEHLQHDAPAKRRLVSLFEANEVAKRLAACDESQDADYFYKPHMNDEVARWYYRAKVDLV